MYIYLSFVAHNLVLNLFYVCSLYFLIYINYIQFCFSKKLCIFTTIYMQEKIKRIILILFLFVISKNIFATHNRAGEIMYRHIAGYTYEFSVITYTKLSGESEGADRPKLEIFWGDGTKDSIIRISREPTQFADVFKNTYKMTHSYSGPSRYIVNVTDPNRIANIINMQNSVNTPFYIEDTVRILNPNDMGYNSSPVLYNAPVDAANVGQKFVHNPNAFDPDGDSLVFSLIPSKQAQNQNVSGYLFPNQIQAGINNQFTINTQTGEIIWMYPQVQGTYNIAILVQEYRNGFLIGTVVRDMQILVGTTGDRPPTLQIPPDICVLAGDSVNFSVSANDPDVMQKITLTSNGSIYNLTTQPAIFTAQTPQNPVSGNFKWKTDCSHLNKNAYPVLFKAEDNFVSPTLVDIKTVFIKILAPAPQNLTAVGDISANSVTLNWDNPYFCSNNSKFYRFSVWRKDGCGNLNDSCNTDLSAQGYTLTGYTKNYTYTDNTIQPGKQYSYKVKAEFADLTATNIAINPFSSLPSEEFCIRLPMSLPVPYNVDVKTTSNINGQINIEWSRPNAEELDTLVNNGYYTFLLYRADSNSNNYTIINSKSFATFSDIKDTSYTDINLNTEKLSYKYKIQFIVNADSDTLGYTSEATSVFLDATPKYKSIDLYWNFSTPWQNESFVIYRKDPGSSTFDSVATTTATNFTDATLVNDSTYCYKIKSVGTYNIEGLKTPLINYSQEICAVPIDTTSPCTPKLRLSNFCLDKNISETDFTNYLVWNFDSDCDTSTIVKTNIYYKPNYSSDYILIDSMSKDDLLAYTHHLDSVLSLATCYKVETIGKNGKQSFSNTVCSDDCPEYELPNTFTPNHDGQNDLFTPILPYRSIEKIDMKIYDRWGVLVFKTENPDINWDGTDIKNGKELPTAVYFYTCYLYYKTANGIERILEPLSGYIHLFR